MTEGNALYLLFTIAQPKTVKNNLQLKQKNIQNNVYKCAKSVEIINSCLATHVCNPINL